MAKYLLNRIMQTIALLLIVSLLSFFLVSLMPSDPVYAQFGTDITQEEYQVAFVRMGLDKPIIVRYLTWLGNVLKGDFGTSYCYHKGVWEVISGKLGTTLYMAVLSLLLSMPIGILLGTVTAVKRGQWADTIITLFSNLLIAIPQFVTAILFLYYISMKWKLLPPQGFTWPWVDFHKHIQQLIMPLTCLTLCGIAGFCRQTRSSVLEVLGQDYVRTARAKGLKETLTYYAAGETVDVTVQRADNGEYKEVTLTLTLGSAADMPQTSGSSNGTTNDGTGSSDQNDQGIQNPFGNR